MAKLQVSSQDGVGHRGEEPADESRGISYVSNEHTSLSLYKYTATYIIATSPVPIENESRIYGMTGPSVPSLTPAQKKENPATKSFSHGEEGDC